MIYVSKGYKTNQMKPADIEKTPFEELWDLPAVRAPQITDETTLEAIDEFKGNEIMYFIAGKLKNNTRNNDNLIKKELVTLDYDDLGNTLYTVFVDKIKEALKGIRFILYPTIKNNLPGYGMRYRLIMDTDRAYSQKENEYLVQNLIDHIGLPCDPKSKTYSQAMGLPYLNVCTSEQLIVKQKGEPIQVDKWLYKPKKTSVEEPTFSAGGRQTRGKYTGKFLNKIVEGATEGNRDIWLTSVIGTMLNQGMNAQHAYSLTFVINEHFIRPSMSDSQVNKIFLSILNKEKQKRGVAI